MLGNDNPGAPLKRVKFLGEGKLALWYKRKKLMTLKNAKKTRGTPVFN